MWFAYTVVTGCRNALVVISILYNVDLLCNG